MPGELTPDDVCQQVTPGQLAIGGDYVVYTLRHVVDGAERTELWTVPFGGGESKPLVAGPGRSFCPRPDPAGRVLAYLHADDDGRAHARLVPLTGGASHRIGDFPRGVNDLAWDPAGNALVVLAEDGESTRVIRADGVPTDASPTAIRLTTIDWRADGESDGGLTLHRRHLHRLPIDGSAPSRLTAGDWSAARPRLDTAGTIYFLADLSDDADLSPTRQVYCIPAGGGTPRAVTDFAGGVLRFHVDGGRLRVLALSVAGRPDSAPPRWFVTDVATGADGPAARCDAAPGNAHLWTGLLGDETDLHDWTLELDDCAPATTRSHSGSTVPIDAATGARLMPGTGVCGALAADGDRRVAVLSFGVAGDRGDPGTRAPHPWAPDLYALEPSGPRRLTSHGRWLGAFTTPRSRPWEVAGPAGPISAYILDPPDSVPCRGTVVDIHGGPTGQWSVVPPLNAILVAMGGFRVVMPNIRGSIDRGALWVAGLGGAWGEADVADVLAVTDALVAAGWAEPGRIGVMGLSYGGFLTQYLIGVTDRFAAAVAENGVANQIAAWAGSDLGPSYNASAGLPDPLTLVGASRLWRASPLRHAAAIRTPLLMLQGGDDRTCPASDNEQLFVALRSQGRTVEYVLYPEESHLMQATGRLDRRIDRHRRVLAWFDTHLGKRVAS